ncbi:BamA/TamA family outer membrane protein [Mucilaginibacter koreensis]
MLLTTGCSLTRRLKNNEALVRKVTITGVDKEFTEAAETYVDKQIQPNNYLNLQFYYLFSKNGKRNIGDPPAILDSNLVEFSRVQMEKFLQNKGYLKAKVSDSITVKNKKAHLYFSAVEGPMFRIRKFQDSILDKKVEALYRVNRHRFSHIQPGDRFDLDSLAFDRDQFYQVMKQNGYYDFFRQYISFNYDSTFNNSVVDIKMIITNPEGKSAHPVYSINNTLIVVANSNGRKPGKRDTLQVDSQFRFVDYSGKFKPNILTRYTFQRKGDIYDINQQNLTTSRLSELNVFRNVPNPTYTKLPDSTNRLNTQIDLVPLKQKSDRVEAEVLFNGNRFGYNLGNTFTNHNLFKQAVALQIKLNWSVLFNANGNAINSGGYIENQDFKAGASLIFPRIVSPFNFPTLGKYGVPHTILSSTYSLFYQNGLVKRQSFINSLTYDWAETSRKLHTLTPINIEFSRGTIDPFARQQLLNYNRYSYVYLIGRTIFTIGSQYTFQLNANRLNTYDDFTYFRGSVDIGGNNLNLLSRLFNTKRDTAGNRTLFGYTFSQYAKGEIDLRFYKHLGGERQFIFRINPGIGVPYGNSDLLIFEKNFYAGGANDIRAWLPRTLGPGNFTRASYGADNRADTLRSRLRYLDQFGEIKIIGNAEYRYTIANNLFGAKLKGAMFTDFGNVWRLHQTDDNPGGEFKLNNLWNSTAIGVGTGLRFDLSYFIFRLDVAFKFKDPQFSGSDQYVLVKHFRELFHEGDFKRNYRIANSNTVDPQNSNDTYHFMQLNFGIGLPF